MNGNGIYLCAICIPLYRMFPFFILLLLIVSENWVGLCKKKIFALEEEFIWSLWEFYIFTEEKSEYDILNTSQFLFWIDIYKIYISLIMCL